MADNPDIHTGYCYIMQMKSNSLTLFITVILIHTQ